MNKTKKNVGVEFSFNRDNNTTNFLCARQLKRNNSSVSFTGKDYLVKNCSKGSPTFGKQNRNFVWPNKLCKYCESKKRKEHIARHVNRNDKTRRSAFSKKNNIPSIPKLQNSFWTFSSFCFFVVFSKLKRFSYLRVSRICIPKVPA